MILGVPAHAIFHGCVGFVAREADRTVHAVVPGVDSASPAIFRTSRIDAFVFWEMGSCSDGGRSILISSFLLISFHRQHFRLQIVDPRLEVRDDSS